jgi:hypothetical protein
MAEEVIDTAPYIGQQHSNGVRYLIGQHAI